MSGSAEPPDPAQVLRDHALLENIRAGMRPPTGDPAGDLIAEWRHAEWETPLFDEVAARHPNLTFPPGPGEDTAPRGHPSSAWFGGAFDQPRFVGVDGGTYTRVHPDGLDGTP